MGLQQDVMLQHDLLNDSTRLSMVHNTNHHAHHSCQLWPFLLKDRQHKRLMTAAHGYNVACFRGMEFKPKSISSELLGYAEYRGTQQAHQRSHW
jgi:hypothetical protein